MTENEAEILHHLSMAGMYVNIFRTHMSQAMNAGLKSVHIINISSLSIELMGELEAMKDEIVLGNAAGIEPATPPDPTPEEPKKKSRWDYLLEYWKGPFI